MIEEKKQIERLIAEAERLRKEDPDRSLIGMLQPAVEWMGRFYSTTPAVQVAYADAFTRGESPSPDELEAAVSHQYERRAPLSAKTIRLIERLARLIHNDPTSGERFDINLWRGMAEVLAWRERKPFAVAPEFERSLREHSTFRFLVEQGVPERILLNLLLGARCDVDMRRCNVDRANLARALRHIEKTLPLVPDFPVAPLPVANPALQLSVSLAQLVKTIQSLLNWTIEALPEIKRDVGRPGESVRADYDETIPQLFFYELQVKGIRFDKELKELYEFATETQIDIDTWRRWRRRSKSQRKVNPPY